MLLYFAGMGLVRAEHVNGDIVWVRTELLAELEKQLTRPFDLTPLMTTTKSSFILRHEEREGGGTTLDTSRSTSKAAWFSN
jgi:hypothetical protein